MHAARMRLRAARVLSIVVAALASVAASLVASAADEIDLELSPPRSLPGGGFWQYRVRRGADLTSCGIENMRAIFSWHTVHVENLSRDTLTCSVKLTCGGGMCFPTTSTTGKSVISPKGQATVIRACMRPEDMYQIDANCQQRPARAPLKIPPNCKYDLAGAAQLDSFYPVVSMRLREQGPVDLAFTLREKEGAASDAEVVGSSLNPRIDEAALKALRSFRLRTTCPGTRFEMRLNFDVDADGRGTVSMAR
jgi:TonB family protein